MGPGMFWKIHREASKRVIGREYIEEKPSAYPAVTRNTNPPKRIAEMRVQFLHRLVIIFLEPKSYRDTTAQAA